MVKRKADKANPLVAIQTASDNCELISATTPSSQNVSAPKCYVCQHDFTCDVNKLCCDICGRTFHGLCVDINSEVHKKFLEIIEYTGWVCTTCRDTSRHNLQELQLGQARLSNEVASLKAVVDNLCSKLTTDCDRA